MSDQTLQASQTLQANAQSACRPARPASNWTGGRNWPAFCAAGASASRPSRSACHPRHGAVRQACAARRSPPWPGSASPGTRGWSRAGTSTRPRRCSTPWPGPCCSTRTSATTCSGWPTRPTAPGRRECKALPPTAQLLLDQLEPFPACIRNARFDVLAFNQAYEDLLGPLQPPAVRGAQHALADVHQP